MLGSFLKGPPGADDLRVCWPQEDLRVDRPAAQPDTYARVLLKEFAGWPTRPPASHSYSPPFGKLCEARKSNRIAGLASTSIGRFRLVVSCWDVTGDLASDAPDHRGRGKTAHHFESAAFLAVLEFHQCDRLAIASG